jgi:hypothetical protein
MPTEMPRQWHTLSFICPEGQQRKEKGFITLTPGYSRRELNKLSGFPGTGLSKFADEMVSISLLNRTNFRFRRQQIRKMNFVQKLFFSQLVKFYSNTNYKIRRLSQKSIFPSLKSVFLLRCVSRVTNSITILRS